MTSDEQLARELADRLYKTEWPQWGALLLLLIRDQGWWRPIESAPKETRVLVCYRNPLGNSRRIIATYYPAETLVSEHTESGYADEGWYEESYAADEIYPIEVKPTCWMPLPATPDAAIDKAREGAWPKTIAIRRRLSTRLQER